MNWMLVLVIMKLAPTQEMDEPMCRPWAIAGSAVEMAVWSRKEVKWTRERAGLTIRSCWRGRGWSWLS
jgi:hypothetical protein